MWGVIFRASRAEWRWWTFSQKRFFKTRLNKNKRFRTNSYDLMVDRERFMRLAIYLKNLLMSKPGHTICMKELRIEAERKHIVPRRFYTLLDNFTTIFETRVDRRKTEWIELGPDGRNIVEMEEQLLKEYEPLLVENLRKLLMLTKNGSMCLKKIATCREELGLPTNFEEDLVHRYPQFFQVVVAKDKMYGLSGSLQLTSWDPLLAVTRREVDAEENERSRYSFRLKFPGTLKLTRRDKEFIVNFQKLKFPSPYVRDHGFRDNTRQVAKRAVAAIHEFLCLTQEKKTWVDTVAEIRRDIGVPKKVSEMLCRYPGIFYTTYRGSLSRNPHMESVYLKEAYKKPEKGNPRAAELVNKGPLVAVKDAFAKIMWQSIEYGNSGYIDRFSRKKERFSFIDFSKDVVVDDLKEYHEIIRRADDDPDAELKMLK